MSKSFEPTPAASRAFRDALGAFGTGVTVVTVATETGPLGMTANSFSSLSLDPPLILWAPAKNSLRLPHFQAAEHFAIHVLHSSQRAVAKAFAAQGDSFDLVDWEENAEGVPVLQDCLCSFECRRVAEYEGGDHLIHVGQVARVRHHSGRPLIFAQGGFGKFSPIG
ncbi:flavin reductase family protein [Cognatishimia sp. SS12]|uniref:flavin reductase family protein n=1 Tax=Cognatishimia sp. SS12 TaxID=2979465 RepID=UPI002330B411|nr:flavin reductase family protein [Cognatishimia sp. SS12]MDC0738559.1 flavin reductase family protein [Cognatishimia sp. SS12]